MIYQTNTTKDIQLMIRHKILNWLLRGYLKPGDSSSAFDPNYPLREMVWVLEDNRVTQIAGKDKDFLIKCAHEEGLRGYLHERLEYRHVIKSWKEADLWRENAC